MNSTIDHIAILVDDLAVAEEWYTDKLDCKICYKDEKYIRIKLENLYVALIDKKHYPHAHFGVIVDKMQDLPVELGETVHHRDGTVGVYVKDPFGNYLEYIWYSDDQKEVFLND